MVEYRRVVNDPKNPPPLTIPNTGLKTARVAVLMLDTSGEGGVGEPGGQAPRQTGSGELVGEFFPGLFALDIVSDEPEDAFEAQWDILLSAMLDKRAILSDAAEGGGAQGDGRARREGDGRGGLLHRRHRDAARVRSRGVRVRGRPGGGAPAFCREGPGRFLRPQPAGTQGPVFPGVEADARLRRQRARRHLRGMARAAPHRRLRRRPPTRRGASSRSAPGPSPSISG